MCTFSLDWKKCRKMCKVITVQTQPKSIQVKTKEHLPYGQGCFLCSGTTGRLRRKFSKLGPCLPNGSSGGINLKMFIINASMISREAFLPIVQFNYNFASFIDEILSSELEENVLLVIDE